MSKCKTCEAEIVWSETVKGTKIPLDAKTEKRFVIQGKKALARDVYTCHFATCPDADKHRKDKTR